MGARVAYSSTIGESLIHIVEPVATQVLRYIIGRLGYTEKFKNSIDIVSDFRLTNKTVGSDGAAKIRSDWVRAKLNPNVNPNSIKWEGSGTTVDLGNGNVIVQTTNGGHANKKPWGRSGAHDAQQKYALFADYESDINLYEKTVASAFSLEVTFDFTDQVEGTEALSRIFQCFQNGEMINTIDIQYDYPMPDNINKLLAYLYKLRGSKPGEKHCINWLKNGSKDAITLLVNRNRPEHQEVVVNKNNFQALYLIECTQDMPTPAEPSGCSIQFTVTVQYARVNRMVIEYPIIVNNQYVDSVFIPMDARYRATSQVVDPVMWNNPGYTKYWMQCVADGKFKPFKYPWWDPWETPRDSPDTRKGYHTVLSVAVILDDLENENGVTKFDLFSDLKNGLGCEFTKDVEEYIRRYRNGVLKLGKFVFITVYADDVQLDPMHLDLSDGHTLTFDSRDPKPVYRIVVSLNVSNKYAYSAYKACDPGKTVEGNTKYYMFNGRTVKRVDLPLWTTIASAQNAYGTIYEEYDQDTPVYNECYDTIAAENTLYFVPVPTSYELCEDQNAKAGTLYYFKVWDEEAGKYVFKPIRVTPGQSLAPYIEQYGEIYIGVGIEYKIVEIMPGDSLTEVVAQYGQLYTKPDQISDAIYIGPFAPSVQQVIKAKIVIRKAKG